MADGENGDKAEHAAATALEHPPTTEPVEPGPMETAASEAQRRENVWTASDARGPLVEAGNTDLPAHGDHPTQEPDLAVHHEAPHDPGPIDAAPFHTEPVHTEPVHNELNPEPVAPERRGSVLPIAAGIVVGAIIGAASALAFYNYEIGSGSSDNSKQIAALASRVDALQARPTADPAVAPLKADVTDLDGKLAALQRNVAALQAAGKSAPPPTQTPSSPPPVAPAFDPAPLQTKIEALQAGLDAVRKQTGGLPATDAKVAGIAAAIAALQTQTAAIKGLDGQVTDLKTGLGSAQKQAATSHTDIANLQAGQKVLEGKVTSSPALAVVADSLVEQIDHGAPYAGQVAALTSLGADPAKVAVLQQNADKGVPSAKSLAAAFDPLVDPMVASEHHVAPNASFMDRMKSGMFSMVSIRAVGDTSGDDLGSRVARIQADLTHDDVSAAFATWDALPPAAKAKSEAWGALAKTHAEAMNAAHALQAEAIKALGTKKS